MKLSQGGSEKDQSGSPTVLYTTKVEVGDPDQEMMHSGMRLDVQRAPDSPKNMCDAGPGSEKL